MSPDRVILLGLSQGSAIGLSYVASTIWERDYMLIQVI